MTITIIAMPVALFVPCYIDQLYPDVAVASLELLERLGVDVVYPEGITCCGQPMANTGCLDDTKPIAERTVALLAEYDAIVCPSGSCTSMVRHHYSPYFNDADPAYQHVRDHTFELCEYLHDVVQIKKLDAKFPHKVSLHQSCHGLRELRLGKSSETMTARENKVRNVLELVHSIEWVEPNRPDDCCGFGGTFAVNEADVSAEMGRARIEDHASNGSDVIVAADMSCLMHLQGLIARESAPIKVMHAAQVLVGRPLN